MAGAKEAACVHGASMGPHAVVDVRHHLHRRHCIRCCWNLAIPRPPRCVPSPASTDANHRPLTTYLTDAAREAMHTIFSNAEQELEEVVGHIGVANEPWGTDEGECVQELTEWKGRLLNLEV